MRYFGVCLLAIAALMVSGVPVAAQQAGAYVLAPGHSGLEFGLYAAPFPHDSDVQVFFVLEVGHHPHVVPAVIHGPAPRFHKKQLKRHRKLHRSWRSWNGSGSARRSGAISGRTAGPSSVIRRLSGSCAKRSGEPSSGLASLNASSKETPGGVTAWMRDTD